MISTPSIKKMPTLLLCGLLFLYTSVAYGGSAMRSRNYQKGGGYTTVYLGTSKPETHHYTDALLPPTDYTLRGKYGANAAVALGYRKRNWRKEFVLGYQMNKVDWVNFRYLAVSPPLLPIQNRIHMATFMANLIYDFNNTSGVIPYVGLGVGFAQIKKHIRSVDLTESPDPERAFSLHDSDVLFAYQFILGVGFPVAPHLRTSLDYRYFHTSRGTFALLNEDLADSDVTLGEYLPVRGTFSSHRILLGLTYFFE